MADPLTIALVGTTVLATTSAVAQGVNANKVAKYNAAIAEQNAEVAKEKAGLEEFQFRRRARQFMAKQRALYGKAGVTLEGSPTRVLADTAGQLELDALAIRYGGELEAGRQTGQARLDRLQGQGYRTAGYMKAGESLLSGGARIYRETR